jgi:hypothetical protein
VDYAFAASGGHFPVFILYFFFTFLFKEKRIVHNKEEEQQENVQELGDLWLLFSLLILYDWHVCIIGEAGPLQFHIQEKKERRAIVWEQTSGHDGCNCSRTITRFGWRRMDWRAEKIK